MACARFRARLERIARDCDIGQAASNATRLCVAREGSSCPLMRDLPTPLAPLSPITPTFRPLVRAPLHCSRTFGCLRSSRTSTAKSFRNAACKSRRPVGHQIAARDVVIHEVAPLGAEGLRRQPHLGRRLPVGVSRLGIRGDRRAGALRAAERRRRRQQRR